MGYADKVKAGSGSTEGVITDYQFTDVFPFGDGEKNSKDDNVYLLLEITPDGADEPTKRSLYLGSGQFLRIEDDGKSLMSSDEDGTPRLYEKGEVFKFIESLENAGFPAESRLLPNSEDESKINFEGMVDYGRVRVVNEIDEAATKEFGKRKVKKGKHKGKEFNRTFTKVTKFWAPGEEPAGGGKSAKTTKGDKPSSKASKATEADDDDEADETISNKIADRVIKGVLDAAKNNTVKVVDIALGVTRYASNKANKIDEGTRDVLRKQLSSKDWLVDAAEREVVSFDAKKGIVSAAE